MKRLLTIREVAKILRVGPKAVYRYIALGQLQATLVGSRAKRVSRADLEIFLSRRSKFRDAENERKEREK